MQVRAGGCDSAGEGMFPCGVGAGALGPGGGEGELTGGSKQVVVQPQWAEDDPRKGGAGRL